MKKLIFVVSAALFLSIYFSLTLYILPEQYMSNEKLISEPMFEVTISEKEISLGESFNVDIITKNGGDYGDIHILSTAFPNVVEIDETVRITTYDFTQTPVKVIPGDEMIARYSGGLEHIKAKYPSIEATSRPIHPGSTYKMSQIVTPETVGNFSVLIKSVNIPHTSDLSHYPQSGILDHQGEFVQVYSVNVNP